MSADSEWMNSEERAYPIVIDPSINKTATYDTYINSASPDTNYGTSTELWLSSRETVYIKTSMPTLPEGSTLYSADLHVYYYYHSNVKDGSVSASAYMVNMDWSENSLTWNTANQFSTRLGLSSVPQSTVTMSGSRGAYVNSPKKVVFDVMDAVSLWYKSSIRNRGIGIKYNANSSDNSAVILKSWESGTEYRAYFVITYKDAIIENGVYKIKNAGNGMYLDVYDNGNTAGTSVIQWPSSSGAKQNHLFKITHVKTLGDLQYYTIRPMTNSGLGLQSEMYGSARNVTIEKISYTENFDNLTYMHLWVISASGSSYTIKNGSMSTSSYLTAPSNTTGGEKIFTSNSIVSNSKWVFEAYTGSMENVVLRTGGSNLITGETYTYDAYMYSTKTGVNGPITYSVTNTDGTPTRH